MYIYQYIFLTLPLSLSNSPVRWGACSSQTRAISSPLLGGFIRGADGALDIQEALQAFQENIFSQSNNLSV